MVGKSSFSLAFDLSSVVSKFSVSQMLTYCSSALDVSGRVGRELSRLDFLAASSFFFS